MHRVACLALLLAGCSPFLPDGRVSFPSACASDPDLFSGQAPEVYPYGTSLWLDPRLDSDQVEAIAQAAGQWSTATMGGVRFQLMPAPSGMTFGVGRGATLVALCGFSDALMRAEDRQAAGITTGGSTGVVALAFDDVPRDRWVVLAAHELGHRLGLHHTQDSRTAMFFSLDGSASGVTEADAQEWLVQTTRNLGMVPVMRGAVM